MSKYKTLSLAVGGFVAGALITLQLPAFAEKDVKPGLPIEDLRTFAEVYSAIKQGYVEPVEDKKMIANAISGMLSNLDPHSAYLDADSFKDLQVGTQGEFGGLGIEVGMEDGLVKVVSPIEDTPAYRAGVKAGDLIFKLDDKLVEIDVKEQGPRFEITAAPGMEDMDINLKDVLGPLFGNRSKKRKMRVHEALDYLIQEEEQKLIDMDQVTRIALERVERNGIMFLDEIDKIAGREGGHGPDVSREGVQRDILPIVEGTTVNTRYGFVRTDHILFIAAGAFHVSKPADLIPELQGRFPIRVELEALTEADFVRIMTEPENALTKQYAALVAAEQTTLTFTSEGIAELARMAARLNERMENIGARRLHTVMTTLLEELLYELPDKTREAVTVDAAMVRSRLAPISEDEDLRKYIL